MFDPPMNFYADTIHRNNVAKGWWDSFPRKLDRHETAMMLTISELAEAMEGDRKSLMDDHLPAHPMLHVELADTMIRLLDLAGAYEVDLSKIEDKHLNFLVSKMSEMSTPERLMAVIRQMMLHSFHGPKAEVYDGIVAVFAMARVEGFDLQKIVDEKLAYNAVRADHKRENRAKAHGKAY